MVFNEVEYFLRYIMASNMVFMVYFMNIFKFMKALF